MNDGKNLEASNNPPPGGRGAGSKIIIAGGGTGGHIFPAIAIANAIMKLDPQTEILFVGAKGKMEMEKIPEAGYKIEGLDIAGFNRSSLIKNIGLPFKLVKSFFQVRKIFRSFQPTAVIGVGGYSSFPVLRFAQAKRIPSFIHESNSFAGKSNMMLGKKAVRVFVASDGMERFFPANKISVSGNPVRKTISESRVNREEGIKFFGLDPAKRTILSIGGSLGAKSINESLDKGLEEFEKNGLQLIWQTGKPYAVRGKERATGTANIWAGDFISRMENAYAAADLVISRSGAMAIAELCVMKKAVIFVPFPYAAEDHQTVNAQNLVNKNAGILIKDSAAMEMLVPSVIALSKDENKQKELIHNIGELAITDADEVIAKEILKLVKK
ncbi:MAG TPA: undecaprenyldiphospho-muramoylpentapeptide beta-N-acetylglucosaminyltransferase [Ferruginibacter sp.]|nr:undecaprenyldiphospho-muramoylpentapeptide beta-N-acetylglucosaminyltransferase [Ferruginibacter sp.]